MTDIEERLRVYAGRWRDAQPPDPPSLVVTPASHRPRGRALVVAGALAGAAAVSVLLAVVGHDSKPTDVQTVPVDGAGVPLARPPLLLTPLPTTPEIRLLTRDDAGVRWSLFARYTNTDAGLQLCTQVRFEEQPVPGAVGGADCGDPQSMSSLTASGFAPGAVPAIRIVWGATSAPATKVLVRGDGGPIAVDTVTTPLIPGLAFYGAAVPAGAVSGVEALSGGVTLLMVDPAGLPRFPEGRAAATPGVVEQFGASALTPDGWDVQIVAPGLGPSGGISSLSIRAGNFAITPSSGDDVVRTMGPGNVYVALNEFPSTAVGSALFAHAGMPRQLGPDDFSPESMPAPIPGMAGHHSFFTENGRAFSLYAVVGAHADRARLATLINRFLAGVVIPPAR